MNFWKMNGAGNDFIIINNIEERLPAGQFPLLAQKLCDRHMSVGADGLMIVAEAADGGDFKMLFYNADGSPGEMCGNGARCICRYGYENGLAGESQLIETTAGPVSGRRLSPRTYRIRLNDPAVCRLDEELTAAGHPCRCSYVELGNPGIPHCVLEMPGLHVLAPESLKNMARELRHYSGYHKGANVNFYELCGADRLCELTYERGVEDFTYACGSGTAAVVFVLTLKGLVSGRSVKADMRGGQLIIDIAKDAAGRVTDICLTGPASIAARGEIPGEELRAYLCEKQRF